MASSAPSLKGHGPEIVSFPTCRAGEGRSRSPRTRGKRPRAYVCTPRKPPSTPAIMVYISAAAINSRNKAKEQDSRPRVLIHICTDDPSFTRYYDDLSSGPSWTPRRTYFQSSFAITVMIFFLFSIFNLRTSKKSL